MSAADDAKRPAKRLDGAVRRRISTCQLAPELGQGDEGALSAWSSCSRGRRRSRASGRCPQPEFMTLAVLMQPGMFRRGSLFAEVAGGDDCSLRPFSDAAQHSLAPHKADQL